MTAEELNIFSGYVYKITNIINGKIYIGETINNINTRFKQHCTAAVGAKSCKNFYFYRAIRKHGVSNFKIEELCKITHVDRKILKELILKEEEKFILEYNSFGKGYNSTSGGRNPLEVSKETRELQSLRKKENPNTKSILDNARKIAIENRQRGVICYNYETGEILNSFNSIQEGATFYNIDRSGLAKICKKDGAYLGRIGDVKLTWRYKEDPYVLEYKLKVYDESGNLLDMFLNLNHAAKKYNIKCPETIQRCCDKIKNFTGRKHGERLVWRYINDNF